MPQIRYVAVIPREPKLVWNVLRYFGDVQVWHPSVVLSEVEEGGHEPALGQIRRLTLVDGSVIWERLCELDEVSMELAYRIVSPSAPLQNCATRIVVRQIPEGSRCQVCWTVNFDLADESEQSAYADTVRALIKEGHEGLTKHCSSLITASADAAQLLPFDHAVAAGRITAIPLEKAYRLINHGPTVLVSARSGGVDNVMAAAWACGLDFDPPKVTLVLDKIAATRKLVEDSGLFAIQVPTVDQLQMTHMLGTTSLSEDSEKLSHCGVTLHEAPAYDVPLVGGCSAWLVCKVIPEAHNQDTYDLFIGQVLAAWADTRVFKDGHWQFDKAPNALRSLHYVAGGQFYATGAGLLADEEA